MCPCFFSCMLGKKACSSCKHNGRVRRLQKGQRDNLNLLIATQPCFQIHTCFSQAQLLLTPHKNYSKFPVMDEIHQSLNSLWSTILQFCLTQKYNRTKVWHDMSSAWEQSVLALKCEMSFVFELRNMLETSALNQTRGKTPVYTIHPEMQDAASLRACPEKHSLKSLIRH